MRRGPYRALLLLLLALALGQCGAGGAGHDASRESATDGQGGGGGDGSCKAGAPGGHPALDPEGPRAAFCLVGCPRSLVHPVVYTSAQRNLFDAYGSANYKVFWYLKLDAGCQRKADPVDREEQLLGARELHRPAALRFVGARTEADNRRLGCAPFRGNSNNAEQQEQIAGCVELVLEDERASGLRYDWVFRVRPDALWLRRFPHHTYFRGAAAREVFIVGDVMMMVPRGLVKRVLGTPQVCNPGGQAHEITVVSHLHAARARVRYQCDHAICPWPTKTKFASRWVPGSESAWEEWRCLSPLTLLQVIRDSGSDASARRLFLNAGVAQLHGCVGTPEEECQEIMDVTSASLAEEIVARWGERPMCGGPCAEEAVSTREALLACEAAHYNFSVVGMARGRGAPGSAAPPR
ncbi:unnamed protein product [Prorocentrum cordatum]|uniref:Uncharacterized protein n=1 Tax=Prorocentrum cordatum TaxID=2364126 RepID=A0ABN9RNG9_9DINO|nr:unnamed protein product [Polarella glacialis]